MNLLKKLWFVWEVYEEDIASNEYCINHDYRFAVGHSSLLGIFLWKVEAKEFLIKYQKEYKDV